MGDTSQDTPPGGHCLRQARSPLPAAAKGLLMPEPLMAGSVLALLASDDGAESPGRATESPVPLAEVEGTCHNTGCSPRLASDAGALEEEASLDKELRDPDGRGAPLGMKLKRDPHGRDVDPRRYETKSRSYDWSPEPLAQYLRGVASQVESNIQNHRLPTSEKLDTFVSKLIATAHRKLRHAPKKTRLSLNALCTKRFKRYWNFERNKKLGSESCQPQELIGILASIVEALVPEMQPADVAGFSSQKCAQPKPMRWQPFGDPPAGVDIGGG